MVMNDPRERDLWLETESLARQKPAPQRFISRQLALLATLIIVLVVVYLALQQL